MVKIQRRLQRQEKRRIEDEEYKKKKAEEDKERKKDPYKSQISKKDLPNIWKFLIYIDLCNSLLDYCRRLLPEQTKVEAATE